MRIVVSGASGKLGPHVVSALRERGVEVSALVRDTDRARSVLGPDIALARGTFDDHAVVGSLLAGSDAFLLLTPHGPCMAQTQNTLVDLAVRAGTRVVKVSGTSSGIGPDGPDACRQHYATEVYLAASGLPWAVIRPNAFMQTLLTGIAATVREQGVVVNPLGSAGIAVVDCVDVGTAAAAVLCDTSLDGRRYVLTGSSAPTYAAMAADIGDLLGQEVPVVNVTPEMASEAARAKGLDEWEVGHLAEMLHLFRAGGAEEVSDDLPGLIGRPVRTVADFVADHRKLFLTPDQYPAR